MWIAYTHSIRLARIHPESGFAWIYFKWIGWCGRHSSNYENCQKFDQKIVVHSYTNVVEYVKFLNFNCAMCMFSSWKKKRCVAFSFPSIASKRWNSLFLVSAAKISSNTFCWHSMYSTQLLCLNGKKWERFCAQAHWTFPLRKENSCDDTALEAILRMESGVSIPCSRIRIGIGLHAIVVQASVQLNELKW